MNNNRNESIDLIKCIAIFFVVFYHSTLYDFDVLVGGSWINYYIRTFLSTGVPLFFLVNGYLLFNKPMNLKKHIGRTIRLFVLTVLWSFVQIICFSFIEGPISISEFFVKFISMDMDWNLNRFWFFQALISIYIVFPCIKMAFDENYHVFLYFVVVTSLLSFLLPFMNQIGILLNKTGIISGIVSYLNSYNPITKVFALSYFCIGGLLGKYNVTKYRNVFSVVVILLSCTFLFGVGMFNSISNGAVWDVVWNGYDSIFTLFTTVAIYLLCTNNCINIKLKPMVSHIGNNTLGVFFLHSTLIRITRPVLLKYELFKNVPVNVIYAIGIVLLLSVFCSVLKKVPVLCKVF